MLTLTLNDDGTYSYSGTLPAAAQPPAPAPAPAPAPVPVPVPAPAPVPVPAPAPAPVPVPPPAPPPAPAAGPVRTTPGLMNIGPHDYYTAQKPFPDLMKSADVRWFGKSGAASQGDALGWIVNLLPSDWFTTILHANNAGGDLPLGQYFVDWPQQPGLAVTVAISEATVSGVTGFTGGGIGSFSLDKITPTTQINVRVANTGTTAIPRVDGIRFYHASNKAALDAGEQLDPIFLANQKGASVLRFMDAERVNTFGFSDIGGNLAQIDFAHFPTEASRTWHVMPPSIVAKICARLGVDIWFTVPAKCTDACVQAIAAAVAANFPKGNVFPEYTNESWNFAYPFNLPRAWLRDVKAAGLKVVNASGAASVAENDKVACAMADGAMMVWTRFEQALGGPARVKRVISGQGANFATLAAAFEYSNPAWYGGAKVKALLTHYAVAPYFKLAPTAAMPDVSLRGLMESKAWLKSDDEWIASWKAYIDKAAPLMDQSIAALRAKAPQAVLTSYEGGAELVILPEDASQIVGFTVDAQTNELVSTIDLTPFIEDGEALRMAYNAVTPSTKLKAQSKPTVYVRRMSATRIKIYLDKAAFDANTPLALDGTGGTVVYSFDNWTRFQLLDARIKGLLDGAPGAIVYDYAEKTAIAGKSAHAAQYYDRGGYVPGKQYGMASSMWAAVPTPRMVWFAGV